MLEFVLKEPDQVLSAEINILKKLELFCFAKIWLNLKNILIFWDTGYLTFMSCKLHQYNYKKITFDMFYFTCNEYRIYKSLTFWNVKKNEHLHNILSL